MGRKIGIGETGSPSCFDRTDRQAVQNAKFTTARVRRIQGGGGLAKRCGSKIHSRSWCACCFGVSLASTAARARRIWADKRGRCRSIRAPAVHAQNFSRAAARDACSTRKCANTKMRYFAVMGNQITLT